MKSSTRKELISAPAPQSPQLQFKVSNLEINAFLFYIGFKLATKEETPLRQSLDFHLIFIIMLTIFNHSPCSIALYDCHSSFISIPAEKTPSLRGIRKSIIESLNTLNSLFHSSSSKTSWLQNIIKKGKNCNNSEKY